jgi:hypothetical protein
MNKHGKADQQSQEAARKKPYIKPGFQLEKVFETQALTCGKVQTTQSSCHRSRKAS